MPELTNSSETAHLAAAIKEAMAPEWQEFAQLAQLPGVQELCRSSSSYARVWEDHNFLPFTPRQETFTPQETAEILMKSNERISDLIEIIIWQYCRRKKLPPSVMDNPDTLGAALVHVFGGGIDKLASYINETIIVQNYKADNDSVFVYQDQKTYLPLTLLMLGARLSSFHLYEQEDGTTLEQSFPQEQIDETIDDRLQAACQKIRENQKHGVPKGADDTDRLFASMMNCLRSLYFRNTDRAFKRQITKYFLGHYGTEAMIAVDRSQYATEESYAWALRVEGFRAFSDIFNAQLDCGFTFPTQSEWSKMSQEAIEVLKSRKLADGTPNYLATYEFFDAIMAVANVHATRHFVDAIADGRLKYSEIMRASMHLQKQPLAGHSNIEIMEIPDEELDWEVLPIGMLDNEPRAHLPPQEVEADKIYTERELDWRRISKLQAYVRQWGDGYIARASSNIKGLSEDRKYYVAVLPQIAEDGSVIEHAIADHPEIGNGLYMWRAERAYIRQRGDRNVGLTWRKVFSHYRAIARLLGAKRFYHTKNLEYNVLDYLTCPPEQLLVHRYAVGKGAVRMARLVKSQEE